MIRCPKCKSTNCLFWEKIELQRYYKILKKPKLNLFGNLSYKYSKPIKHSEIDCTSTGGYECGDCGNYSLEDDMYEWEVENEEK